MKRVAVLFCLLPFLAIRALGAVPSDPGVPADVQTLVQGNNAFALDLYAHLRDHEANLFYSPYSISTALAMTYAGARGETAEQMARVLHFSLDSGRLHPAVAELIRDLQGHGLPRDYRLDVAQSLWGDARLAVRPEFASLIHTNYGARLRLMDFQHQPDEVRQRINQWVDERTNDKIKDLLHAGDLDGATRLVLVNAIYFKAAWQKPFAKIATQQDAVFHTGRKDVRAALMHQAGEFNYAEGDSFQALELPYEDGELSMVVLLPRDNDGLGKVEKSLTAAKLHDCLHKRAMREVQVALPRFKLAARFDLGGELQAMGMPLAFSPAADFSGMSTGEKLMISKVVHQAFVEVDEAGTEAAAATAVGMKRLGLPDGAPVVFRADHPFLFLLRDNHTGSILFLGRVTNPSAGTETGKE
jgi:serpin B